VDDESDDDDPEWSEAFAQRIDGAVVLVGLTYDEPEGKRQEQFFGTVMRADLHDGIMLRLEGSRAGEIVRLPPDPGGFLPAEPGSYRLRSTGECVEDPDYTASWTVSRAPN